MTYSIVARDRKTGELGVSVQSHYFQVGPVVPWAAAGVGAVATQSMVNIAYGPLGLELLRNGYTPEQAIKALTSGDPTPDGRQVAIVDAHGAVAAYTGPSSIPAAGHHIGDGFSCQANLMEKDTVWGAMAEAFVSTDGPLAERMMAALDAAEREGGDIRGRQSAAMLVVTGKPTGHTWEDRVIDLRVEDAPDPLAELRRLLRVKRAYMTLSEAEAFEKSGDPARMAERVEEAVKLAPDMVEIAFWAGLSLAGAGRIDEGARMVDRAVAKNRRWIETIDRCVNSKLVPAEVAREVKSRLTAHSSRH
jgi:uncharacterized Ntn-hydrolase superfamily protein